jgi:hypothetical protein
MPFTASQITRENDYTQTPQPARDVHIRKPGLPYTLTVRYGTTNIGSPAEDERRVTGFLARALRQGVG